MIKKINTPFLLLSFFFILILYGCRSTKTITKFSYENIEPRSSWNAQEAKPFKTHIPIRITVHHEGTKLAIDADAAKKINAIQKWGMGAEKNWADIPYHFLIAPNGKVYEGRSVFSVGETSTEYAPTEHLLICCLGNLNEDTVPAAQLKALIQTIEYCARKYNIPIDSLATHRDFSTQTTCPGKFLTAYFENGFIKKELRKMQKSKTKF
jgi:N-acetylmuramoyl-L-alanine amidase